MTKNKLPVAAAIASMLAMPAFAASWQPYINHSPETPRAIYTQENEGVATLLSCDKDGQLSVLISYKKGDFIKKMKANAPYRRTVEVSIIREGVDEGATTWSLIPAVDTLHTKAHADAAKIYNASILGQEVIVRVPREGDISLVLPAVDDVFHAFSSTCQPPRAG
ncbi:hypothetical protein [Henriciella sp.]|uniref:hypothetical protein n=1 Tax=Henriciella sp. TaxID=1968823 RepID=UPI0026355656|nr:hypothetical protein [Henriciella sp.]